MFIYSDDNLLIIWVLLLTSPRYKKFGTKLSPIFGFAKYSQIQNQLSIKPNTQIACSVCWQAVFLYSIIDLVSAFMNAILRSKQRYLLHI